MTNFELHVELTGLMEVAVNEHNKYRRRHGVPDMKPSEEVKKLIFNYNIFVV